MIELAVKYCTEEYNERWNNIYACRRILREREREKEREREREERKNYRIELKQKWILIVLMKSWMKDFRRGIVSIYLKIYLLINYKKKLSSVSSLMIKKMNFIKGGGEGWSPLQIKFKEIREIIFAFWHYNKMINQNSLWDVIY